MEIFEQFGFDFKLFAAQIVNFLVIAFIFKKFLYKPILTTLQKRNDAIKKGLKDAENAAKALEKAEETRDEILNKAGKESERIITEAKQQAEESREKIISDTRAEIERMMAQTKEQIALERDEFRKEARDLSLEMSKQILENAITGLFEKKDQEALVKKGIQKIKNDKQTKN